ncbi:Separin [Lachnellula subtilissima]|uniref:separase n=1 Tax=Lachnellula subtilissima TaxID=602034 RepID=A0A8H8UDB6_9HELO|nr:Separin [Lachnellula subtilissima]
MASLHETADSIRAAVGSTTTCTPATATILSDLLLPKITIVPKPLAGNSKKPTRSALSSKATKPAVAKTRGRKVSFAEKEDTTEFKDTNQLSPKERSILATEIINATLKSLSEAIKAPTSSSVRRQASSRDLVKGAARRPLIRSNSAPQSPLQPRSLNRVSTSPSISSRPSRSSSSASITISGNRSTAECARLAFACLRALQNAKLPGIDLPPLQLENGMSVLVGKLITLGLDDLATKELRILKKRLHTEDGPKRTLTSKANVTTTPQTLAELLDFGRTKLSGTRLGLVIQSQLHILRLMTSSRKQKNVEAALPILDPSHPSSPTNLLLLAAKESKSTNKIARQLQSLSDLLLSLCPSVSSSDDALALESRLSVTPEASFQLQTLAFHNRISWWKLAGHKANHAAEFFDPFLRCLSTFARRNPGGARETYQIASAAFVDLKQLLSECVDAGQGGSRSVLTGICRTFSSLAQEANLVEDAIHWTLDLKGLFEEKVDSDAKMSFIVARLAALTLKRPSRNDDEDLLLTLLEVLERPLKGESLEIDDLMTEVSFARRAAISVLAASSPTSQQDSKLSDGMRQMCESLVFICPRLCSRYLGKPLDVHSSTKDIVRHEQRRQFIAKSGLHSIDSALFVLKMLLGEGQLTWDLLDSKLQDCIVLLDRLELKSMEGQLDGKPTQSYHVKISNVYYTYFLNERRNLDGFKETQQLRVLRRSVDCVRTRSKLEKKAALLSTKLERMAGICKIIGRYDELFKILVDLRDEMVKNGVLSTVAVSAASQPLRKAWNQDDETSMLARTVQTLLKVQLKYLDPSLHTPLVDDSWTDDEKGVLLEHQSRLLSDQSCNTAAAWDLQIKTFEALISVYTKSNYPIRRLRVLIQIQSHDLDFSEELTQIMQEELRAEDIATCVVDGTKDESLRNYLLHFQTLAISTIELMKGLPPVDALKRSLVIWSDMRTVCGDLETLERQIEDIPDLLSHLQSIADYSQVKGLEALRLAVLRLIADFMELRGANTSPDDLIFGFTNLGSQWLQLGYSGKAGLALDRAESYSHQNGVSSPAMMQLHLSSSEYSLAVGNFEKCEDQLARAQLIHTEETEFRSGRNTVLTLEERTSKNLLMSNAYSIYSMLALQRGSAHISLNLARQSVRLLRRAWANTEEHLRSRNRKSETERLADEFSRMNMSTSTVNVAPVTDPVTGSNFWALVTPFFRSLNHLALVYEHHGMFQESLYYVDQGYQLMKQIGAEARQAMGAALKGNTLLKAGDLEKGSELLAESQQLSLPEKGLDSVMLSYHFGNMHGLLGDKDAEIVAYEAAEEVLNRLVSVDHIGTLDRISNPADGLETKMSQLALSKPKAPAKRKALPRPKAAIKIKVVARVKSPVEPTPSIADECSQLISLKGMVLRQKARALMEIKKFVESLALLDGLGPAPNAQLEAVDHGLAIAKQLLLQSMEQMTADPVYSVLQDSTISFPSVMGPSKSEKIGDRLSVTRTSPPKKSQVTRNAKDINRAKSPAPDSFFDRLRQAQEHLIEAHSVALCVAPIGLIHRISAILNSVSILLSAAGHAKGRSITHPGFASCTIETARNLAHRREHKAIHTDTSAAFKLDDSCWPSISSADPRRSSLGLPHDLSRFQRDYIDIIPKSWTAVSISLSDSRNELSITKLQAGHSSFVLRLPLGRHNSMDADEEVFGFEQGQSELREIIELANESSHDARDMIGKEAKTAWWEEREALDARLKDLLENIEKVWLGGFTGIFSQHARRPELLARFQKSFHNILDKHLPSRRQKTKKKNASPRITLDSRIMDLFIGLGDAADEYCDFSEPLTDLLYFVIDVLQFHGELNAYAEIDFDSIVIETHDALRCYHEAVRASGDSDEGRHTILILDKALHSFPWESLPCMEGQAVSRLPSLSCLRDRILASQPSPSDNLPEGCYARREKGSYILNPDGDLKNTQTTFGKALQTLDEWDSIVKREPTEAEFKASLESNDIFLYFGHGSGAQYIRAREIRKLQTCAVTFLMGCSSGALTEVGEFEPYGTPINYMHAGSPAVVATLWDVTDKDIDRFAKVTFEHWGLFEGCESKKGKGKKKEGPVVIGAMSLIEAVAKGREACNLRYLNAAAVCVYGVPVYLN